MKQIKTDFLIIGAGLVGSITARTLAKQGYSGFLLERSVDPGGVNGSFQDKRGNWFDHGRHIIDYDRSEYTRDFVLEVLKNKVHRFELKRKLVVRGEIIDDAVELEKWPEKLARQIKINQSIPVKVGSKRKEFAEAYGQWFADLVFDEMLQAYPVLKWQLQRGIPEENLMRWIFPWFFPRSDAESKPEPGTEINVYSEESRQYHYRVRHREPPREQAMYPQQGGYVQLISEMISDAQEQFELRLGLEDLDFEIDPDSCDVKAVRAGGCEYIAEKVFWCAPLPVLCRYLNIALPEGEPIWEVLGSFTFQTPVLLEAHEVLFADPRFRIRRINNPGKIAGQKDSFTLQVEYTCLGEEAREGAEAWQQEWSDAIRKLEFIGADNVVDDFDFRTVSRGIVSTEDLQAFLETCKSRLDSAASNLFTPHLAVAADNNCRLIPQVVTYVEQAMR